MHLLTCPGICKVIGIILGIMAIGFESHSVQLQRSREHHDLKGRSSFSTGMDAYFIVVCSLCVILTLISLVGASLKEEWVDCHRLSDILFHIIAALALFVGGSMMLWLAKSAYNDVKKVNVIRRNMKLPHVKDGHIKPKIIAGGLAITQHFIYVAVACGLCMTEAS